MDERSVLDEVVQSLQEYGFDTELRAGPTGADGLLVLHRAGITRRFVVELATPLTVAAVAGHPRSRDSLFVTEHVSARTAETLRRLGVAFADTAGNAFLETEGWYVDVRGRRTARGGERPALEAPVNLYSARRAQVVFALLTWPDLLDASIRTLATAAGVSVGIAQSTANELRRRVLWPDREDARAALIDGWAAAYPDVLARSLTLRAVRAEQVDRFFGPVWVSGEAAPSARMRAVSGVVYVDELSTELLIENRWRTDGPANLIVRRRFWAGPEPVPGEAPPLLVYGDLLASDDPRTRSVAAEYRRQL